MKKNVISVSRNVKWLQVFPVAPNECLFFMVLFCRLPPPLFLTINHNGELLSLAQCSSQQSEKLVISVI